jgi:putative transposase
VVQNKSCYLVVGVDLDGRKDVLGMWLQRTEGAKFWLAILNELKQRGLEDIFVLCADGLTGLPQAVEAAFPRTIFQTCIVHMIRSSTRFVPWKERREVCKALKAIYTAASVEDAEQELEHFESVWGSRFPMIGAAWRARWAEVTPSLPSLRRSVAPSTRPTRSRPSTANCGRSSRRGATCRTTRQPSS